MRFKLFGTEIYVSFLFSAMLTVMLATDRTGCILPLLFAAAMHELGHLTAMRIIGCAPTRVRLVPAAVEITARLYCSRKGEIAVALAGPAVNLLLFFGLFVNYGLSGSEYSLMLALVSLLACAYNLLPVAGLDGGTVLYLLIASRKSPEAAALAIRITGLALAGAALFAAVFLCLRGEFNISLFITVLYLTAVSLSKN